MALAAKYSSLLVIGGAKAWSAEAALTEEYFAQFGDKGPEALHRQLWYLRERIGKVKAARDQA